MQKKKRKKNCYKKKLLFVSCHGKPLLFKHFGDRERNGSKTHFCFSGKNLRHILAKLFQRVYIGHVYFSDKRKYSTKVFIHPPKRLKFAIMINDDNFSMTTARQSFNLNWVNNENWTQEKCSLAFWIFLRWQLPQMIKPNYLINSIDTATKLL